MPKATSNMEIFDIKVHLTSEEENAETLANISINCIEYLIQQRVSIDQILNAPEAEDGDGGLRPETKEARVQAEPLKPEIFKSYA